MDNPITVKTVRRWYYKGKGYSSKKLAYKKWAYKFLLDELFGEVGIKEEWGENVYGQEGAYEVKLPRVAFRDKSDEEIKAIIHDAFMEKFPHEVSTDCETICVKRYREDGETEDGYYYDSCRAAQKDWLENKANELIATPLKDTE